MTKARLPDEELRKLSMLDMQYALIHHLTEYVVATKLQES